MSQRPASPFGAPPDGWAHIDTWLFDLDNTLYPPAAGLLDQVNVLMTDFITGHLNVSEDRANQMRRDYWQEHGATLTGLVQRHGVDPDTFLQATHRLDLEPLSMAPQTLGALRALPGRKVIHTNGPRHHAERVLRHLDILVEFDQIIALEDTGYVPKPAAAAHRHAVEIAGLTPSGTAMIEDSAANLKHPADMGMTTVWLRHGRGHAVPAHVHRVADDLDGFLDLIADR